ncbi:MAG TPA: hypothetical protein VGD66_04390 [Allosphingosinicella sp.]
MDASLRWHDENQFANAARMTELPKTFDPAEIEARWYARWEREGLFRPERPDAEPFTIVIRRPTWPARSTSAMRST